jgi:hypothetical protein
VAEYFIANENVKDDIINSLSVMSGGAISSLDNR